MTSIVQITPHGKLRVTSVTRTSDGATSAREDTLEAGAEPRTFYVHRSLDLLIAEDQGQPPLPVVQGQNFEQDLLALESEHSENQDATLDEMISAYELRLYALKEQQAASEVEENPEYTGGIEITRGD